MFKFPFLMFTGSFQSTIYTHKKIEYYNLEIV